MKAQLMTPPTITTESSADVAALEARNVTKSLPLGRELISILKGISLRIEHGEFAAIVGPSGSGKSTLLGIIAGLDNPTSGQVFVDGVEITKMSESRLAKVRNQKIGMVFQAFNLIPTLTAQENVEIPLYVGKHPGSPSARATELLKLVGLGHRLRNRPNQMSGGEQQRVGIARAIVTDPTLLLCDEPTGDLDRKAGDEILSLLQALNREHGKTIIMVTHDPHASARANRTVYLDKGQLTTEKPE